VRLSRAKGRRLSLSGKVTRRAGWRGAPDLASGSGRPGQLAARIGRGHLVGQLAKTPHPSLIDGAMGRGLRRVQLASGKATRRAGEAGWI